MFDAVLRPRTIAKGRSTRGAVVSLGVHILILGGVMWLSSRPREEKAADPEVTFFNPAGKGLPGKPPLPLGKPDGRIEPPKPDKPKAPKKDAFMKPRDPNAQLPKPATSAADSGGAADDIYGDPSGDPSGVPWGDPNGTPGAGSPTGEMPPPPPPPAPEPPKPQNAVIPFGAGMERPHKVAGPDPTYTREAREARIEGKMLVQCVITTDGTLSGCSILKSLPFMDQAVLAALAQQRWTPVSFQGQPVSVMYTIPFTFVLK
ncbi:MAG: energy transducer TonB [Polyangiaceae bacterium]|nr:energy transducer TonB [Polyangiaceae bacterium]